MTAKWIRLEEQQPVNGEGALTVCANRWMTKDSAGKPVLYPPRMFWWDGDTELFMEYGWLYQPEVTHWLRVRPLPEYEPARKEAEYDGS